jgi:CheY-like chemotaxis protein
VLEPFYTTKGASGGAGLGLSIVHGVVKAHGGAIDIASQPGQGTSVRIRIPRIPAPVAEQAPRAALPVPRLGKVLLVDDEEDVRFLMARMLTRAGVDQVETAAGGEEALSLLRPGRLPDLIILDQNMPGMSGVQVLERVRGLYPDLPVLFSSGQPGIETWERLRQPRVAVISKPFTMDEIQAKLALF